MNNKQYTELYRVSWSQEDQSWTLVQPRQYKLETESQMDLCLARAVLARIMAL